MPDARKTEEVGGRPMTKTFEEWLSQAEKLWLDQQCNSLIPEGGELLCSRLAAKQAWHARDVEVAEKDRRIAELASEIVSLIKQHAIEKVALEARIEAGMALAEHWKAEGKRCYDLAHKRSKVDDSIMAQSVRFWHCADELRAALGEPVRE
jgi:hypothetical protein